MINFTMPSRGAYIRYNDKYSGNTYVVGKDGNLPRAREFEIISSSPSRYRNDAWG